MIKLKHPNIALCYGWFEEDGKIWIEQELCVGELRGSYIHKFAGKEVPELEVLKILWQVG